VPAVAGTAAAANPERINVQVDLAFVSACADKDHNSRCLNPSTRPLHAVCVELIGVGKVLEMVMEQR
jgi:hypothetical protein